jgi:hypothetical protein
MAMIYMFNFMIFVGICWNVVYQDNEEDVQLKNENINNVAVTKHR